MSKSYFLFFLLVFVFRATYAQYRQVYSSAGNTVQKGNIYLSQSIGQDISYSQQVKNSRYLAQGFQQPMLRSKVSINSKAELLLYPNPTDDQFTVTGFEGRSLIKVALYDAKGALCTMPYTFSSDQLQANLLDKPAGIYMLQLFMGNGEHQSVKIIKSDK